MIPKVKDLKLIATHMYICDIYDSKLRSSCERFSNNCNPDFTDMRWLFTVRITCLSRKA